MASMQIPNNSPGGNREQGMMPVSGPKGAVHGYNQSDPGDHRNGTSPLGGSAGVIKPPNDQTKAPIGHSSQR